MISKTRRLSGTKEIHTSPKNGITKDLGLFEDPDGLFAAYTQKGGRFKIFMFENIIRHLMNRNIEKIRGKGAK